MGLFPPVQAGLGWLEEALSMIFRKELVAGTRDGHDDDDDDDDKRTRGQELVPSQEIRHKCLWNRSKLTKERACAMALRGIELRHKALERDLAWLSMGEDH